MNPVGRDGQRKARLEEWRELLGERAKRLRRSIKEDADELTYLKGSLANTLEEIRTIEDELNGMSSPGAFILPHEAPAQEPVTPGGAKSEEGAMSHEDSLEQPLPYPHKQTVSSSDGETQWHTLSYQVDEGQVRRLIREELEAFFPRYVYSP